MERDLLAESIRTFRPFVQFQCIQGPSRNSHAFWRISLQMGKSRHWIVVTGVIWSSQFICKINWYPNLPPVRHIGPCPPVPVRAPCQKLLARGSWGIGANFQKMFGVIVSGRLVQTDFQQVGETQFLTTIQDADNVNHIVVFLVGIQPFPIGTAGLVYFSWPDPDAPPSWQLLGHISNEKPSAIYKINNLKKLDEDSQANRLPFGQQQISHNAQIGISIEPIMTVQSRVAEIENQRTDSFVQFTEKMLESFVNFTSSFAVTQSQMVRSPNETYVPLSSMRSWYTNFQRRLQLNPYFWRN